MIIEKEKEKLVERLIKIEDDYESSINNSFNRWNTTKLSSIKDEILAGILLKSKNREQKYLKNSV